MAAMEDEAFEASLADLVAGDGGGLAELLAGAGNTSTPTQEGFVFATCSYSLHPGAGEKWLAPSSTGESNRPFSLRVRAEKLPAQFGANGTFRWHKNCVLPRLRVVVEGGDESVLEGAAVLLSAVTVDVMTHTARSVGLEGVTLRPLVNRACSFSSLSFTTTSYNLPGRPSIHLMASLLCLSSVPQPLEPTPIATAEKRHVIACSSISPALTVDARKRQSKHKGGDAGGVVVSSSAVVTAGSENPEGTAGTGGAANGGAGAAGAARPPLLPFAPDLLERRLEKVGGKAGQEAARTHIDNSMEGLRAYLSALNIRHKCRHPLFLVLRFNACVRLLYDGARESNPAEDDDAFFRMMRTLDRAVGGGGTESSLASSVTGAPGAFAPFVIAIKTEHDATACEHTHCPVRLCTTLSLPHAASLPASYEMLSDLQTLALRQTYCRLHCSHSGGGGNGLGRSAPVAAPNAPALTCSHPTSEVDRAASQRQASSLLASLNAMSGASSAQVDGCPEFEWSHGLRVLAEAMSMHCRTRSAAEIVAFMHDEASGREKRHSSNARPREGEGVVAVEAFEHDHATMTMLCDQQCEDASMEGSAHAHEHAHAKVEGFWS